MMTRQVVAYGVFVLAVAGAVALGEARADEQGIGAKKILLKANKHSKEKLVFLSKDPAIEGQSSPPTDAYLEFCSPAEDTEAEYPLPASAWKVNKKGVSKVTGGNTGSVLIKPGRTIKIVGRLAADNSLVSVGMRLTIGEHVQCALFTGTSVVKDEPFFFQGKDAPAPPDCSDATLGCPGPSPSGAFVD